MNRRIIAVLGAKGMLGTDLVGILAKRRWEVLSYARPEFDITDTKALEAAVDSADAIVNCAAYTDVDGAETNSEIAWQVNSESVGELADYAGVRDKYIVHVSTDFVFDGENGRPYLENDTTNPVSVYGHSKLGGEQLLQASGCRHCIIRTQWTYGKAGNNFISKIVTKARTNSVLSVVSDQVGSPTAAVSTARAICDLLEKEVEGLFHFASRGYASRHEIAAYCIDKLGLETTVSPCSTSAFPCPARRPLNSRFDCTKIDSLLTQSRCHWQENLDKFLEEIE